MRSTDRDNEKCDKNSKRSRDKVGERSNESSSEGNNEQNNQGSNAQNKVQSRARSTGRTDERNNGRNNGRNHNENNEASSGRSNEKSNAENSGWSNEKSNAENSAGNRPRDAGQIPVPSRATLPRRAGMTPRPRIPQWLRDQVLVRDGHRCTYVGSDGRCPAVTELEIDHICPHAQGGSNHIDNLRTLCRAHNQRAAEIVFGEEFMRRRRGERPSWLKVHPSIERADGAAEREVMSQIESVPV